jgi:Zn-dependent protease
MRFSEQEIKELGISALVIGFIFAWIMRGGPIFRETNFFIVFAIMLVAVGAAFIFHELAHKAVAQRFGCWAEYRMWDTGLIMAFLLAVTLGFVFAAPGAVYIQSGYAPITRRENGLISLAGPVANLGLALLFLMLAFGGGVFGLLGRIGFIVNTFLALFNMIPFPPLDGSKVMAWDKKVWAAVIVTAMLMLIAR